jgi:hypothetical protein
MAIHCEHRTKQRVREGAAQYKPLVFSAARTNSPSEPFPDSGVGRTLLMEQTSGEGCFGRTSHDSF